MPSEFIGIHLLYLDSKILVWRFFSLLLVMGVSLLSVVVIEQSNEIQRLRYAGDVKCDPGYIAKVVEGEKTTCIMHRVSPGQALKKLDKSYLSKGRYHADTK